MTLLDAKGRPLDPVERAMEAMAARVSECLFGAAPENRVHDLRRSVLGDAAGPGPNEVGGLAAWVQTKPDP
jgi:hypothetical protein